MPSEPQTPKKTITPDWLVQGALTRVGDMFDKLTGRSWKPANSLATSGLIERMKTLLNAEIKQDAEGRNFVPHNIKLKMQWDKFSTDSEENLKKLENELLTAAVDHISDNRYYTYAPIKLEAKPDYFTEGVKLFVSFDTFHETEREAELNVTIPAAKVSDLLPDVAPVVEKMKAAGALVVKFDIGSGPVERRFDIEEGKRLSVGRTKENDVALDHTSVSKMHASLLLNSEAKLVVADTGSTNGTYLNGERIAYGKAIEVFASDTIKFGAIDVELEFTPAPPPPPPSVDEVSSTASTETYNVGEFQFSKKTEVIAPAVKTETPRTESETNVVADKDEDPK